MFFSEIISKKRDGKILDEKEIRYFVKNYTTGDIPDYQASAFLMTVFLKGMNQYETTALTLAMAESGEIINLSSLGGITSDKHSTGGVGDKTTLIAVPMAVSLGAKMVKMSGRGLGFTGGTSDKLSCIPNVKLDFPSYKMIEIAKKTGLCFAGQSENIAPADKKIYALRDVTATVESIPLIASSIMSKKIASGADCILLDVKFGSGAFIKTVERAEILAKELVRIGESVGKRTTALITDMENPLGNCIGNAIEISESIDTLDGRGPCDLEELCIEICSHILVLSDKYSYIEAKQLSKKSIEDKSGLSKFLQTLSEQGANIDKPIKEQLKKPKFCYEIKSKDNGYISKIDAEKTGHASLILGAGRKKKEDDIDNSAGIMLNFKYGDYVEKDTVLAYFYADDEKLFSNAEKVFLSGYEFTEKNPPKKPLIYRMITKNDIE